MIFRINLFTLYQNKFQENHASEGTKNDHQFKHLNSLSIAPKPHILLVNTQQTFIGRFITEIKFRKQIAKKVYDQNLEPSLFLGVSKDWTSFSFF